MEQMRCPWIAFEETRRIAPHLAEDDHKCGRIVVGSVQLLFTLAATIHVCFLHFQRRVQVMGPWQQRVYVSWFGRVTKEIETENQFLVDLGGLHNPPKLKIFLPATRPVGLVKLTHPTQTHQLEKEENAPFFFFFHFFAYICIYSPIFFSYFPHFFFM